MSLFEPIYNNNNEEVVGHIFIHKNSNRRLFHLYLGHYVVV